MRWSVGMAAFGIGAEADGCAAEVPLMIFDVATAEVRVGSARGLREIAIDSGAHRFGVSGENVGIDAAALACVRGITVAGRAVDEECDRVRAGDFERCVVVRFRGQNRSAFRHCQQCGVKAHACLMFLHGQPRVVVYRKRLTLHDELVFLAARFVWKLPGRSSESRRCRVPGLSAVSPHDDHLVRCREKISRVW